MTRESDDQRKRTGNPTRRRYRHIHPEMVTASSFPPWLLCPSTGTLMRKVVLLAFTLFWPIYEIVQTSDNNQPLRTSCRSSSGNNNDGFIRLDPLIGIMATYLHLLRARNTISLYIAVLIAIDIRITFGWWNLGRKMQPKA